KFSWYNSDIIKANNRKERRSAVSDLRDTVAKNICELRQRANMTQLMLAGKLNYSDKAISKWERGESFPDIFMLKSIADHFGVSVDYLFSEDHGNAPVVSAELKKMIKRSRMIISVLANMLVWLMATVAFVAIGLVNPDTLFPAWLVFCYALPLSALVALIFNSIWGRHKFNYLIIALMSWFSLVAVYLSFLILLGLNMWLIFLVGVPTQIIISLWSAINYPKDKTKKKRRTEENDTSDDDASASA
ncbi:MAG: helix-turn-helix domain-containing protein, partial [Clostridia bacterium]|nr:helix-turn-helix domain-containing protein [Clostridia bacterium]